MSEVFLAFLKLGLTAFGGPIAHLGYYRDEFVERRRWLSEEAYADIVALCQMLPGPASTQTAMCIGLMRAGTRGAVAAWLAFTLPSALIMLAVGLGAAAIDPEAIRSGWLHGLKVAAVAVVAQALWGMAASLCPDRPRQTLAILAAVLVLAWPHQASGQVLAIVLGAIAGYRLLEPGAARGRAIATGISRAAAVGCLASFVALLAGLPLLAAVTENHAVSLLDSFYRAGSLVFGGGHVVLPLLRAEVVVPGWIGDDLFLTGYGAAQALPGPLFTFSAYLGTVMEPAPNGTPGAALCLAAIFLPSFLLVFGVLPFWESLRQRDGVRAALSGVNAAVVGLLAAAFYDPVWTSGILNANDLMLGLAAFGLLAVWRVPPWLVVGLTAIAGALLPASW